MTKTDTLGRPWLPFYIVTLEFDPSFTNIGTLRLDNGIRTSELDLTTALADGKSSIIVSDLHKNEPDGVIALAGELDLKMVSGSAKITSIKIEKTIYEYVPNSIPSLPTSYGRGYELIIDPVPEPGTGIMVGCGVLGALGFRRQRR